MACKKTSVDEKKERMKDEDLEKVSGGLSGTESVQIEFDQTYFSGPTQHTTYLDPQPSAPSDSKGNAARGK